MRELSYISSHVVIFFKSIIMDSLEKEGTINDNLFLSHWNEKTLEKMTTLEEITLLDLIVKKMEDYEVFMHHNMSTRRTVSTFSKSFASIESNLRSKEKLWAPPKPPNPLIISFFSIWAPRSI